jgi:hypothetical protein
MSTGLFYTGSKIVFWEQDDFAMHRSYYSSSNPLIGTGSFTGSVIYFGTWSSGSSAGPSHVVTSSSAHGFIPITASRVWTQYTESNGSSSIFYAAYPNAVVQWQLGVSGSSGSANNFREYYDSQSFPPLRTSSFVIDVEAGDFNIHKSMSENQTPIGTERFSIPAVTKSAFYVSSSGKIGIGGTTSPTDDIDLKADTIKLRSNDGKRELEFDDAGRWKTKKFADSTDVESSGSEIVLTYTPGTFDSPAIARTGDILGSIVWEDLSIGNRDGATAMAIKGEVANVAGDGSSVAGSLGFYFASHEDVLPTTKMLDIQYGQINIVNSATLHLSSSQMIIGNFTSDADRRIVYYNQTTTKRWIAGVDESQTKFAIHQGTGFVSANDFEIDSSGNIVIQGTMTCTGLTGSFAIDGGTF